ncbi:LacI family DNA-binding transcriptional regulator [Vitreimonas sp.]|uniref:LacI family DNA-binding transcriptional regulator n=1 Tax=Vitreimonas sp. TaxID=3069702 RepID=UPI002EDA7F16
MADDDKTPPRRGLSGEKKPTINDVARLAGVSKKTVSRVINQSPFVKGETRENINRIIAEIGFSPDPQARGLAFRRSFLIGLVYDNPNPQYVVNMQLGMLDAMRGSGYELVVHPCNRGNPTFLADFRRFIERQKLSGVVLTPSVSEDDRVKAILDEIGCAYIRIASVPVDEPQHIIVSNDRQGGRAAARHLAELGHTRIGFISGPPSFRSSHERYGGFVEELKDRGLKLDENYIIQGAYTFETGISCGAELLKREPRPTAIFAANDEMAAGVLHAVRRAGLTCPNDVSVVGFDDFQIASSVWPPLTTVRTPTREIGRMAAEKLIGFSEADEDEAPPREAAPATSPALVVRDSTGPAPR